MGAGRWTENQILEGYLDMHCTFGCAVWE
jgi:hypothetical protein